MKKMSLMKDPQQARGWVSVKTAAELLEMSPEALRRALERHAVRAPDGVVEATIDGILARTLGRSWRVAFSEKWLRPEA